MGTKNIVMPKPQIIEGKNRLARNSAQAIPTTNLRHIVYSVASHNALSYGASTPEAMDRAAPHTGGDTDLIVVFTTRSTRSLDDFDGGRWPRDARIVFRGTNELSQRYRA